MKHDSKLKLSKHRRHTAEVPFRFLQTLDMMLTMSNSTLSDYRIGSATKHILHTNVSRGQTYRADAHTI